METRVINEYFDINSSIVQIQQFGLEKTLVPPQKDCTNYHPSQRSDADTPNHMVVVIPGNPGIVGYYHDFILELIQNFDKTTREARGKKVPILSVSHNNFDHPSWKSEGNNLHIVRDDAYAKGNASAIVNDPNQMELQIRNKVVLFKKLFDLKRTKLFFIGHSIGCYVIMRILQDEAINSSTLHSFFIHPALENLALTDKGSFWSTVFRYKLDWIVSLTVLVLDSFLPVSARLRIFSWLKRHDGYKKVSPTVKDAIIHTSSYKALQATTSMAKSEFSKVKDLELSLIEPMVGKLKIYYAQKDHWVNRNHREILKDRFPGLTIEVKDAMHAFILQPDTVSDYATDITLIIQKFCKN